MAPEEIYASLGRAIASRRSRARLTQAQLANLVDMSRASIANIERGRQTVSVHNLYAIAAAMKVDDLAELLPAVRAPHRALPEFLVPHGEVSVSDQSRLWKMIDSIATSEGAKVRK